MHWRMTATGKFYDAGEHTVVYFDTASGDTHLISDFAAFLLRSLVEQSLTTSEVSALVAPQFDMQADNRGEITAAVASVLEELRVLDIIYAD
jgi:PqqD family protein of HPr-rel-A system